MIEIKIQQFIQKFSLKKVKKLVDEVASLSDG